MKAISICTKHRDSLRTFGLKGEMKWKYMSYANNNVQAIRMLETVKQVLFEDFKFKYFKVSEYMVFLKSLKAFLDLYFSSKVSAL